MATVYRTKTSAYWTPECWDRGRKKGGRFVVYRPDCPKSDKNGSVYRYHVVWWLTTGTAAPDGWHIHHKNGDPLDDRFENLEALTPEEHRKRHPAEYVSFFCKQCGKECRQHAWKQKHHEQQFCSLKCFGASISGPQIERGTFECEHCQKTFQADRPTYKFRFCSLDCYHASRSLKANRNYICQHCNKPFTRDYWPTQPPRFCSMACSGKARQKVKNK